VGCASISTQITEDLFTLFMKLMTLSLHRENEINEYAATEAIQVRKIINP